MGHVYSIRMGYLCSTSDINVLLVKHDLFIASFFLCLYVLCQYVTGHLGKYDQMAYRKTNEDYIVSC